MGGFYSGSREHLDRVEELGNLPNSSGKSRSVPRLTLMSVTMDNERGQYLLRVIIMVVHFRWAVSLDSSEVNTLATIQKARLLIT